MSDEDETPEQRTERFRKKAEALGPQAWHEGPTATPEPTQQEKDDKIREGIGHAFSPDWAKDVGKRLGERIKASPTANRAATYVTGKLKDYADWTQEDHSAVVPPAIRQPMEKVQAVYMDKAYAEQRRRQEQDLELQAVKDKIRALQAVKDRQAAPRDEGELDEPGVRQPIQMQREFSNENDKREYVARKAVDNAKKPRGLTTEEMKSLRQGK